MHDVLTAHAPDFILMVDRAGTILFINRVVAPLTVADVVGKSWFDFVPKYDHERIGGVLDEVFRTGRSMVVESASVGAGGKEAWYGTHIGPVVRDGEITGAVLIARDISEQRQSDAQLRVVDRLATVGTLAAGVAHGINNPLSAVVANLSIAGRVVDELGDHPAAGELANALRDAGDAAMRIGDVVGDLAVFLRVEDDHSQAVDVNAVLEATLRLAANEIRHRARLVKELADVPPVRGNQGRLGQVFMNLIVNAAQAIPEGRADRNIIHVRSRVAPDGRVEVDVIDTGVGMAPDVVARLFTPFFTARQSGESAGLGLAISQRIVTALGGEITVSSTPRTGSTFTVRLPAMVAPVVERTTPRPTPPAMRRGKVLVIDDEPMITTVVRRVLKSHHDVVIEHAAAAALARISAGERFDAILCDLMMPEVNGMDVHDELARIAPEQLARTTFMTGGAFTERARQFVDRLGDRVIAKPFLPADLIAAVAAHINRS
jgi:PAS domain S-box-containing protein